MSINKTLSCEASSSRQNKEGNQCDSIDFQNAVAAVSVSHAVSPAISQATKDENKTTESCKSCDQSGGQARNMKPNCYKCAYRGEIPGDAHSECKHPAISDSDRMLTGLFLLTGMRSPIMKRLNISGNEHGIKCGWFYWPLNFDPVWLESCDGFMEKDEVKDD